MTSDFIFKSDIQSTWSQNPEILNAIPTWFTSIHMTCCTLLWATIALVGSVFLPFRAWCALATLLIGAQHVTDALDGSLGRHRGEGWVALGFTTDHIFDSVFFSSLTMCLIVFCDNSWASIFLLWITQMHFITHHIFDIAHMSCDTSARYSSHTSGIRQCYWAAVLAITIFVLGCVVAISPATLVNILNPVTTIVYGLAFFGQTKHAYQVDKIRKGLYPRLADVAKAHAADHAEATLDLAYSPRVLQ